MQIEISARSMMLLRTVLIAALVAVGLEWVVLSLHAPMIWDTPTMRYVNFLMDHGMQPYSQIGDLNMPGAYLTERWVTWIFGQSDLGCRIYEFFEMATLIAAAVVVAGRGFWFGGLYAGGFFVAMHASEGPLLATERDELVMVMVVVAFAFLFESMRRRRSVLMVPFGIALGVAASIKPTVLPLEIFLLLMAGFELHRRGISSVRYIVSALAGTALIAGIVLGFLVRHRAVGALVTLMRTTLPAYAGLNQPTFVQMVLGALPVALLLVIPFGVAAVRKEPWWREWENRALALGTAMGLFSYFVQGKGFVYHRYLLVMFLLLCVGKAFASASRSSQSAVRTVGALGMLATLLFVVPYYAFLIPFAQRAGVAINQLTLALEDDLTTLGGGKLQGQVECFDMVGGCLDALYHLRLVERTGSTGDTLYFSPTDGAVVEAARRQYWAETQQAPPEVVVVGNEWFQGSHRSFDKLNAWPSFAAYLKQNYALVGTRSFSSEGADARDGDAPAYRIYLLKGSSLMPAALTQRSQPASTSLHLADGSALR